MNALKNMALCLATLSLQSLSIETGFAQSADNTPFKDELSKQESIYQTKGEHVPAGYSIDRSLADYARGLTSAFDRTLANLGPKDRWLDIGAGKGHALLDYYTANYDLTHPEGREQRGSKAQSVAISIEDRRANRWLQEAAIIGPNKIRYLFDRPLQAYSLEELGQFQVITDVIGGFSYSTDLAVFMEKVLGLLELNGSFFTLLQDVHAEGGTNRPHYPGGRFLTEIANADGSDMKMCTWLKRITCVEVTCEFTASWKPPIEAYRVRKVCNNVTVPALLTTHFEAGTPPERRFRMSIPPSPVPPVPPAQEQASVTP
jgi:SAM-dependent methyltransferase